jgi:ArsR family transcriptional regulator, arsenate/arsenite/antimonite-responsive transcriptional repressor
MIVNMLDGMKRTGDPDVLLLQGAADPTRLAILRQLAAGGDGVCACDFTACCDVAQPTVSHHLKVLRETGWVRTERRGSFIYYFLEPSAVERFERLTGGLTGVRSPGSPRSLPVVQPIANA